MIVLSCLRETQYVCCIQSILSVWLNENTDKIGDMEAVVVDYARMFFFFFQFCLLMRCNTTSFMMQPDPMYWLRICALCMCIYLCMYRSMRYICLYVFILPSSVELHCLALGCQ